jgi:ferrous iron transport protein B
MAASAVADRSAMAHATSRAARVALIGNPNTGKTTLFNRLCGARAKTSNFPGTTTATREGRSQLTATRTVDVVDLPGVYQLHFEGPEAQIARGVLRGQRDQARPDLIVVLVDASNLSRNLVLVGEMLAYTTPVVVALNMMDLTRRRGLHLNVAALSRRLGVPVVPMVASKGEGLDAVRAAITGTLDAVPPQTRPADLPKDDLVLDALAAWADSVVDEATTGASDDRTTGDALTERIDRIVTHPVFGILTFLAVMGGLFWTLFALATYPMDLIEWTFTVLGDLLKHYLPGGPLRDLLTDGIVGGIAGTVVFLPQIMLLFFLISLLEDTGYLARAAFVNDRLFKRFGLPGQAFVPLLTSHACALPGIMSTRLIPNRRDRLVTILIAPFMSCSARLPVYVLLTSLLFADRPLLAGAAFAACYLLGAAAAFLTALLMGRTVFKGKPRPMVLELPTYKRPSLINAVLTAKDQGLGFLKTAGTVIVAICIVMWWLSAYPRIAPTPEVVALRAEAAAAGVAPDQSKAILDQADARQARAEQGASFAGRMGRVVQPVFAPLGYDWQLTDGILTSFIAREVFVSTMAVLAGHGKGGRHPGADEGVMAHIRGMKRDDGSLVFTRATAASALVFFVLAMQCLSTLVVTRKEAGSWKYAALQFGYMSGLAYVSALVVYQALHWVGIS